MNTERKRHWLLPVLCFMTFIGSGFGFVISVLSLIDINLIRFVTQIPTYTSVLTNIADAHFAYSIFKALLYFLSIYGAWLMLKNQKKGFFYYLIAQLALPLISFFFFPYPFYQTFAIVLPEYIFAFAFIGLYSLHLNNMQTNKNNLKQIVQKHTQTTSD